MIVQLALAHDGARLTECLSEISRGAQRHIKECVAETPIGLRVVELIGATTTKTGLKVESALDIRSSTLAR
jgi:hypothetical protein